MENKGLLDYVSQGKITKAFMEDYKHLCNKIYSHWALRMDFDEFFGFCTEKLVDRIGAYDPKRSTIGNYCYNVILNEARRVYSLETHLVNSELEDVLLYQEAPEPELIQDIWKFAVLAYRKGIYVDQDQLYADYQRGRETPCTQSFCWLRSTGRL